MSTPTAANGALPEAGERFALIQAVTLLLTHVEDVVDDENWQRIDAKAWNKVTGLVATNRAALSPASPAPAVPSERSVTSILLSVVPGDDGMGFEVYAKSVEDVEDALTRIGGELEDWQLGIKRLPPAQQTQSDAVAGAGWMPIETAPKDGQTILLGAMEDGEITQTAEMQWSHIQRNGFFPSTVGMWVCPGAIFAWSPEPKEYGPTHWKPLSAATPPQQATPSAAASIKPDVQGDMAKYAARYRFAFIESPEWTYAVCKWDGSDWLPINCAEDEEELDAAIDAARAALKEAPGGGQ